MVDLSNFASNKKILNGVILFKVTLGVTLTQPIYIYVCVCVCVCVCYVSVWQYWIEREVATSQD